MGSELSTETKPGLAINRHLSGYVAGTCPLDKIEIIRNGKVLTTFDSDTYHLTFTYDDMVDLDKVVLTPPTKKELQRASREDANKSRPDRKKKSPDEIRKAREKAAEKRARKLARK